MLLGLLQFELGLKLYQFVESILRLSGCLGYLTVEILKVFSVQVHVMLQIAHLISETSYSKSSLHLPDSLFQLVLQPIGVLPHLRNELVHILELLFDVHDFPPYILGFPPEIKLKPSRLFSLVAFRT